MVVLLCWIVFVNSAFSQAVPISRMQSAISGVIQQKAIKRGFAANDPRYIGTLRDVSAGIAGTAATAAVITGAAVTAPAWITYAVAAGIGTLVTYAVSLGIEGLVKWLFNGSNVDIPGTTGELDPSNGMVANGPYWSATGSRAINGKIVDASARGADRQATSYQVAYMLGYSGPFTFRGTTSGELVQNGIGVVSLTYSASGAPMTCAKGTVLINGQSSCSALTYTYTAPGGTPSESNVSVPDAVKKLSSAELQLPVNPEVVANTANAAWRNAAAQPGYSGLPYSVADPITSAEVSTWRAANPNNYPTVGDAVAPQSAANSPWQLPVNPTATSQAPGTYPAPGTNPAQDQPLTNLGPDPAIGAPTLEEPPTADQILKPVFDMLPGFKNFAVPSHSAECPKPQFELFERQYVMDAQCTIAENNRSLIAGLMAAVWIMLSVIIVLRA
jgi:hypothetical protein